MDRRRFLSSLLAAAVVPVVGPKTYFFAPKGGWAGGLWEPSLFLYYDPAKVYYSERALRILKESMPFLKMCQPITFTQYRSPDNGQAHLSN